MTQLVIQLILTAVLAAAPPLTAPQQQQLATAHDQQADTDEGALYPLLENALTWPDHVEAGATIPDYAAIEQDPAAHRGQLFFIQGKLRRTKPIGKLALPGPWEGRLSEWAIQYGSEAEQMLIVNLVDPPEPPRDGSEVKLAARFYKLWPTTNKFGSPKVFLVFVGKDAQVLGVKPSVGGSAAVKSLVLVLVLVVFGLFWIIRRTPKMSLNPKPTQRQMLRRQAMEQRESQRELAMNVSAGKQVDDEPFDSADAPLPADPAQALAQLQDRHLPLSESDEAHDTDTDSDSDSSTTDKRD